jgi:phytoene synthase
VRNEDGVNVVDELSPLTYDSPTQSLADAYAYCRRVTQKSSSNFYHAFRLLSSERYDALCAFYAFCRFMDDIADQAENDTSEAAPERPLSRQERLTVLLNTWREELQKCYAGTARHPISYALSDAVRRFPIDHEHLTGIIDGVAMDLHRTRYESFDELYTYCYHVASLVGLVCIEIFGHRNPTARDYAINLGVAFQLTNILRDVAEDAQRNRIYLPGEDLVRFGYTEQELLNNVYNEEFLRLMSFEGDRARDFYKRAVSYLAPEDRRTLVAAEAMRLIYSRLLEKLEAKRFQVFGPRVSLSTPGKIGLAFTAWVRGRLPF